MVPPAVTARPTALAVPDESTTITNAVTLSELSEVDRGGDRAVAPRARDLIFDDGGLTKHRLVGEHHARQRRIHIRVVKVAPVAAEALRAGVATDTDGPLRAGILVRRAGVVHHLLAVLPHLHVAIRLVGQSGRDFHLRPLAAHGID